MTTDRQTTPLTAKEDDLESLATQDLEALQRKIGGIMEKRRKMEKTAFVNKVVALAEEAGIPLNELANELAMRHQRMIAPDPYRNPSNPAQSWSGRGKRPDWLREFISKGGSLEDCRTGE